MYIYMYIYTDIRASVCVSDYVHICVCVYEKKSEGVRFVCLGGNLCEVSVETPSDSKHMHAAARPEVFCFVSLEAA